MVGFDDLPAARWASPPLTTVRQPLRETGHLAAQAILQVVRGRHTERARIEMPTPADRAGEHRPPPPPLTPEICR